MDAFSKCEFKDYVLWAFSVPQLTSCKLPLSKNRLGNPLFCRHKIYLNWINFCHKKIIIIKQRNKQKTSNHRTSRISKSLQITSTPSFLLLSLRFVRSSYLIWILFHQNTWSFQMFYPPLCKHAILLATEERGFLSTNPSMGLIQQLRGKACEKQNWIAFAEENKPKKTSVPWRFISLNMQYAFLRIFYFRDFQ